MAQNKKIQSLTLEQEKTMYQFRDKWIEIGLRTGDANIEAIRPVINRFYATIGKDNPYIWRCQSPLQAQLILNFLRINLSDNLSDNLRINLRNNLRNNLSDNLRDNLRINLRNNLSDNLRNNLSINLSDNLRDNLSDNLRYYSTWLWGSGDSFWISFYLYPQIHLKSDIYAIENLSKLEDWGVLAENCFWWYPYNGICFVCDRPSAIHKDENTCLHCENAMALEFSDGYGLYMWHGMPVSKQVIMQPDTITAQQILGESNAEIRRVMLTRYRHSEQITGELSGEVMWIQDIAIEPQCANEYGAVYMKTFTDDEPMCYVRVVDPSTGRVYFLRIDPHAYNGMAVRDPQAAVASTWRKADGNLLFADYHDYVPVAQT